MPRDKKSELFYWVDEEDNVLGSITRSEAHNGSKKIHRAVAIILWNDQGNTLLQQRSLKKDLYPGFWTTAASGHVTFGQNYDEAAIRELEEEVGLTLTLDFHSKQVCQFEEEIEIEALYIGQTNQIPDRLDPFEVQSVKWVDRSELKIFHQNQLLTPGAVSAYKAIGIL